MAAVSNRRQGESRWARFGGFEVELRTGELSRQGRTLRLADKPFQVLATLIERPGELVTREELRDRLWSDDTFVDFDNNLNAAVSRLREALNDSPQGPRFIETIPRKGYRFVGPPPQWDGVEVAETAAPAPDPVPVLGVKRRRIGGLLGLAALAAVAVVLWVLRSDEVPPEEPDAATGRGMLAVLPFENLSDNPERQYLADGMTEELLTRLAVMAPERLGVIARTSVRRYRNTEKTIEEISDELGVDFVIEGSVRAHEERLRITVQLIRATDQTHMWAQSYDREALDLLGIQDEIAIRAAEAIVPQLILPVAASADTASPKSAEAFDAYLEGLHELAKNDVASSRRAARHFERALALEPDYARCWLALAQARNVVWFGAETPEEAERMAEEARAAALRALQLSPSLSEAYAALAFSRFYHAWDADGAAQALSPALEGASSSAEALELAVGVFSALARHDEATAAAAELLVLDPASPSSAELTGWSYLFARRPSEAEKTCRAVLEQHPGRASADGCLYQALLATGRLSEAAQLLAARLSREGVPEERFQDVDANDSAQAIRELERIRLEGIFARPDSDVGAPFDAAVSLVALGDLDMAFGALDMALDRRDSRLLYLAVDPRFDALRTESRFAELQLKVITP